LLPVFGSFALLHFYLLQHEATHKAISKSPFLNDTLGHIFSWVVVIPYIQRRKSHLLHHVYTSHPQKDPANKRMIQRFSVFTDEDERKLNRMWRSWFPMIVINDRAGLWLNSINDDSHKGKQRFFGLMYICGYLLVPCVLYFSDLLSILWGLYAPALFICMLLEELVNMPHHAESFLLPDESKPFGYWEQYKVSHSCGAVPIWSKWIALNFNFHATHHLFPWLPWNHVPKVQKTLEEHFPEVFVSTDTNNEISWSLKNRKRDLTNIMKPYFDRRPVV
jgi:fatty acid desaturase